MTALVTFDFHNTIAYCDEWFALEIRDLPVRTLEILAPDALRYHDPASITASYRALRQDVMTSGKEVDAVEGVRRITSAIGLDFSPSDLATTIEHLMSEAHTHATPVPGVVDSIRHLAQAGIVLGVVSSAVYHPFLEWTLDAFGIANDLAFIFTSASTGYYKSDPEIYRTAIRAAGAPPKHAFHVGDSERWDVESARHAGMRTVWFANGRSLAQSDHMLEIPPDHIVRSMADVAPLILDHLDRSP